MTEPTLEETMVKAVLENVDVLLGERAALGFRGDLDVYLFTMITSRGSCVSAEIRCVGESFKLPSGATPV